MADSDTLYHYCSPEAFLKIIQSRCLWLTHISFFEDQQEQTWFEEIIRQQMRARDRELVERRHRELEEFLQQRPLTPVFCGSFSTEPDMLTQWNAYADRGRGFTIGFNRKKIESLVKAANDQQIRTHLSTVSYDLPQQREIAEKILNDAENMAKSDPENRSVFPYAMNRHNVWWESAKCKNPLFAPEKEIRLIQRDYREAEIKFRMRGSQVVPYVEFNFRPDEEGEPTIFEIWLGPRVPITHRTEDSIVLLMEQSGYRHHDPEFPRSNLKLL